jgi:hypothetical protein
MSKFEQSISEMFGATIELDCRLCPCIEVDGGETPLPVVRLPDRGLHVTSAVNRDWTRPDNQRIIVTNNA